MTRPIADRFALFDRLVLGRPILLIGLLMLATALLGFQARHFRLDASAETLVLEDDEDLRYARAVNERYGQSELLVITYTPSGDLFAAGFVDWPAGTFAELLRHASTAQLRDTSRLAQNLLWLYKNGFVETR